MAIVKSGHLFKLDNLKNIFGDTHQEIDKELPGVVGFIEKQINKCMKNPLIKPGQFTARGRGQELCIEYLENNISLLEFGRSIARDRFELKREFELATETHLFICEIEYFDKEYIVGIEVPNKETVIYQSINDKNTIKTDNSSLRNFAINNSCFFAISTRTGETLTLEKLISTKDDEAHIYADRVLEIKTEMSIKEALMLARSVKNSIVMHHKLNKLEIAKKFEDMVSYTINSFEDIDFEKVGEKLFFFDEKVEKDFKKTLMEAGLRKPIKNRMQIFFKKEEKKRIVTNTGIQIIIPERMLENIVKNEKDYIEIVSSNEGVLGINLKNIKWYELA